MLPEGVELQLTTASTEETLAQLRVKLALSPHGTVFVQSDDGEFVGQIVTENEEVVDGNWEKLNTTELLNLKTGHYSLLYQLKIKIVKVIFFMLIPPFPECQILLNHFNFSRPPRFLEPGI